MVASSYVKVTNVLGFIPGPVVRITWIALGKEPRCPAAFQRKDETVIPAPKLNAPPMGPAPVKRA